MFQVDHFLEKNKDTLKSDVVELLCESKSRVGTLTEWDDFITTVSENYILILFLLMWNETVNHDINFLFPCSADHCSNVQGYERSLDHQDPQQVHRSLCHSETPHTHSLSRLHRVSSLSDWQHVQVRKIFYAWINNLFCIVVTGTL